MTHYQFITTTENPKIYNQKIPSYGWLPREFVAWLPSLIEIPIIKSYFNDKDKNAPT